MGGFAGSPESNSFWVARHATTILFSIILLSLAGIYLASDAHLWSEGWVGLSFLLLLVISFVDVAGGFAVRARSPRRDITVTEVEHPHPN